MMILSAGRYVMLVTVMCSCLTVQSQNGNDKSTSSPPGEFTAENWSNTSSNFSSTTFSSNPNQTTPTDKPGEPEDPKTTQSRVTSSAPNTMTQSSTTTKLGSSGLSTSVPSSPAGDPSLSPGPPSFSTTRSSEMKPPSSTSTSAYSSTNILLLSLALFPQVILK